MIEKIVIKERGATPRGMAKAYNAASKSSWYDTALYYHQRFRSKRFSSSHAHAAGYRKRQGDELPYGSKEFWRSYIGRKLRLKHHRLPLVWSGRTRERVRSATIVTSRNVARVRYQANVLNFDPRNAAEFRKILPEEARQLGRIYDRSLSRGLKQSKESKQTTI